MTKDEIVNLITSRGYWKIIIEPLKYNEVFSLSDECVEIVKKNFVDYVGWDYPHFPTHNYEYQGIQILDKFAQSWTNFGQHKEFWRMYKSSQFIHYLAFVDDWWSEDIWKNPEMMKRKPLQEIGIIFGILSQVTHIFKFILNLCNSGLYNDGFKLSITIKGLKDRKLWDGSGKFLFLRINKSHEDRIEYEKTFSKNDFITNHLKYSTELLRRMYHLFGWTPSIEALNAYQDLLIKTGRIT